MRTEMRPPFAARNGRSTRDRIAMPQGSGSDTSPPLVEDRLEDREDDLVLRSAEAALQLDDARIAEDGIENAQGVSSRSRFSASSAYTTSMSKVWIGAPWRTAAIPPTIRNRTR